MVRKNKEIIMSEVKLKNGSYIFPIEVNTDSVRGSRSNYYMILKPTLTKRIFDFMLKVIRRF